MVMKKNKSVLITDLDNTLYDWFRVWHSSFSAMLDTVVTISGISKAILIPQIKAIHQKHGTSEYAFLLENIPALVDKYGTPEAVKSKMTPSIEAYRQARSEHLKLYPTVEETLKLIKSKGALVVVYTESKSFYSNYRIQKLGLDKYIDYIYSPSDHAIPETHQKSVFDFKNTIQKHTPEGELKPNPHLLMEIIEGIGASREDCVYIGDSEMKDIEMAQQASVDDVFAKYGNAHFNGNDEAYNLLREVTHWTEEDVEREKQIKQKATGASPSITVEQFGDLLKHFNFTRF